MRRYRLFSPALPKAAEGEGTIFQQQLWEEQEKRAKADAQIQALSREMHEARREARNQAAAEEERYQRQISEMTFEKQKLEREIAQTAQEGAHNQARADELLQHRDREKAKTDELLRQSELTRVSLEDRINHLSLEVVHAEQ